MIAAALILTAALPLAGIVAEVRRDDADEQQRPAERVYFDAIRDTAEEPLGVVV